MAMTCGASPNPKVAGMLALGGSYPGAYLLRRGVYMPWELYKMLGSDVAREGLRRLGRFGGADRALEPSPATAFGRVAALETQLYMRNQLLRDTDWASMAHSVEVRVPLVDATLLGTIAPLVVSGAIGSGKKALAAAPSSALPAVIGDRPKTGFATPIADWQRRHAALGVPARVRSLASITRPGLPWARRWALHVAHSQAAEVC
jgi:asparagine synthase (glutamine-hydrolysing)